jgi:ribosomal protein S18 acetylase RimI-like enzyme
MIRRLDHATDAERCDAIIASLSDWFGMEEGIRDCAAAVRSEAGFVADEAGDVRAFLTWVEADGIGEITWMGVHVQHRRRGLGRQLMEGLTADLRARAIGELRVKTLSARHPDPGYGQTRAFYEAMGFTVIEELGIWGPENPCALLARDLSPQVRPT